MDLRKRLHRADPRASHRKALRRGGVFSAVARCHGAEGGKFGGGKEEMSR